MKLYFKLLVVFMSGFMFITSCKKYLEKSPSTTLSTPTTLIDLQGILDNSLQMNHLVTPNFGEASSDDYFLEDATYNSRNDLQKSIYVWNSMDYYIFNNWSVSYRTVYNANLCLDQLEKIEKTAQNAESWNKVKGSALFFRANTFLNLVWVFSKSYDKSTSNTDLGIDLRLNSDPSFPSVRSNVEQTYQRIISDAKESIQYLTDNSEHVFRPSKAASYGLLARTYLSMREYDSAFRYANLCLAIKNNLVDFNSVASGSLPFSSYAYSPNGEVLFHTTMHGDTYGYNLITPSRAKIDTVLFSLYSSNDLRRSLFFQANGNYYQFKGFYSILNGAFCSGVTTDEMYLIKSECYARAGDKVSALTELNTLLRKRHNPSFVDVTAPDAFAALEIILTERRKELVMRGIRWSDIKRLNKEGRNILLTRVIAGQTYTLLPNAEYYALPLPTDIIELTGMPQNPR